MKTHTLFKRGPGGRRLRADDPGFRDAPWYFKFVIRGRTHLRCTNTPDAAAAQAVARLLYRQAREGDWDQFDLSKHRQPKPWSTISDLITAYESAPLDIRAQTRTGNIHCLRNLLRTAGAGADPETIHTNALNADLARLWFGAAATRSAAAPDDAARNTIRRTANSIATQAKSLFTGRAMAAYEAAGLIIPDLGPFLRALEAHHFSRVPTSDYLPPAETAVTAAIDTWPQLPRNQAIAAGLALTYGLRRAEILQARWEWLMIRDGIPCIDGAARTKANTGRIIVRALDPYHTTLQRTIDRQAWRGAPTDLILTGTDTDRTDTTFRGLSQWLRDLGWGDQSGAHALRDYAASQIIMRYGPHDAQTWLRHSSVTVTEQHYSTFVKRLRPEDPSTLPTRWATATTEFTPIVLPSAGA